MRFAQGPSQPRAMTLPNQYLSVIPFKIEEIEAMVGAFECYYLWQAQEQPGKPVDPATSVIGVLDLFVSAPKFDAFLKIHISPDPKMNKDVMDLWMKLRDKLHVFWVNIRLELKADPQLNFQYSMFLLKLRCSFILMFYHKLLTK